MQRRGRKDERLDTKVIEWTLQCVGAEGDRDAEFAYGETVRAGLARLLNVPIDIIAISGADPFPICTRGAKFRTRPREGPF